MRFWSFAITSGPQGCDRLNIRDRHTRAGILAHCMCCKTRHGRHLGRHWRLLCFLCNPAVFVHATLHSYEP